VVLHVFPLSPMCAVCVLRLCCVVVFPVGTSPSLLWAFCDVDHTTALTFHGDNHC
jgi:hypothetical protein